MQEDVSGVRIMKACVRETYEKVRFGKANDTLIKTQLKVLVTFAFMNPVVNALMYIVVALILLAGSYEVGDGGATPGSIMAAITYTTQLLNGILMLVMLFQNISRGLVSWKRVKEILESEPELKDGGYKGGYDGTSDKRGVIEFRDVSFSYPGSARTVLKNINLKIRQGETIAIMGVTGCGKTSLANLIPRFYDVTEGAVLVDGVDVREYDQHILREKAAVVLQKSELFGATIRENILWGDKGAPEEMVKTAAAAAQADEFITRTAEGYDTIVAERGMRRMSKSRDQKLAERNIPGMNRHERFVQVEYAENAGKTLKRITVYFTHEKKMVLGMLVIVICGTLFGVYAPSLQSRAIDIIAGKKEGNLAGTLLFMLSIYLLYSLSQLLQGLCSAHLSQRIVRQMREELFGKIADLPVRYLDTHSHGDVMSRMTNDIENISTTVSQSLPSLFSGVLTIAGTVSVMLWYCWQLALLSVATVFLTLLATKFLSGKVRKFSRRRQMLLGRLNGTVEEMISGYRTVVAYNHQEVTISDFCSTADELTKAGIRTDAFSGVMGPVMNCIGNIGFVIIAAFGGYFSVRGMISVGVISAFIVYAKQFSRPINEIAQIYGQLQTAIAGAERVFLVLDEDDEDKSGGSMREENNAEVTFENVQFSYEPEKEVIRDFTLTVPSGKKVALVGAIGSGKTTIVNLLMRFYDIDSGKICINDQNIKDISRDSLRKNVAIVLQDTVLFSDTVRNNLRYGKEDASDAELLNAAEMSRCREMIESLPQGFDTVLEGAGENISQGQRQLLAIARAFAADPKILILDEATSNVDTRTERAIQDAMQRIMQNRTSIVIAHRLSTIRDSDLIVVMDQGRITESGTHESLLAKKGRYYELYMTQYAGYAT